MHKYPCDYCVMDNITLVDLVIPIYNLRNHRYNNFCFLVEQLAKLRFNRKCNIVVCEQESSSTPIVESFLTNHSDIKHLITTNPLVFNKSVVINHAFHNTDAEFFWVCDCDLSFDFEHVVNNINISSDFIRPFDYVVSLSESESEYYMKTGTPDNTKQDYVINKCTGKYSFIVRRKIFESVGLMNEDFEGWGFQDLDFSENRMSDYKPNIISGVAYHLYHKPADRTYVDKNRRLYMNLGGCVEYEESSIHKTHYTESERLQDEVEPVILTQVLEPMEPLEVVTESESKLLNLIEEIDWGVVDKQLVWHRVNKNNIFNINLSDAVVYDDSMKTTINRSVLNRGDISRHTRHFVHWYFKYIVENYNTLSEVVVFLSDVYLRTPTQLESGHYKKIIRFLKTGPKVINKTNFFAGDLRHSLDQHGHLKNQHIRKSRYTYKAWLSRYLPGEERPTKIISPSAGCMMVTRDIIQKRPFDFYVKMLSASKSWGSEDFSYCVASYGIIFS
jgi:hypothetical protein